MWQNPRETADLVTFTEKSLMENFIFRAVTFTQFHSSEALLGSFQRSMIEVSYEKKLTAFSCYNNNMLLQW